MSRPSAIRVAARLLVEDADHLLVALTDPGPYAFLPGGGVEPGESVAAAAARELEEETGIPAARLAVRHPLGVLEHSWVEGGRALHAIDVVLAARIDGLAAHDPVPAREPHLAFGWLHLAALPEADIQPRAWRRLLPEWRARGPAAFAGDMAARP